MIELREISSSVHDVIWEIENILDRRWQREERLKRFPPRNLPVAPTPLKDFRASHVPANQAVLLDQAGIIREHTIVRKRPAVWFLRWKIVPSVLLTALCKPAGVPREHIDQDDITDDEFRSLVSEAMKWFNSPLRTCKVSQSGEFIKTLESLSEENLIAYAVCDWKLQGKELTQVRKIVCKAKFTLFCPT